MRIHNNNRALHTRIFGLWLIAMSVLALTACQSGDPLSVSDTSVSTTTNDVIASVTWVTDTAGKPFVDRLRGQCPQAEFSLERVTSSTGTMGGIASAQFSSTLGTISGVSVGINGASYALSAILPMQPDSGRGNPFFNGGGRNGGGRKGSLFAYPLPTRNAPPTFIPLAGTGMTAVFSVTGYALSDNSIDVPNAVTITAPTAGTSVSRTGDLTITWNALGTGSSVFAILRNAPIADLLRNLNANRSNRSLAKPITKRTTDNSATSVTFTATELQTLNAGSATIEIMVVNTKSVNNGNANINARSSGKTTIVLQ